MAGYGLLVWYLAPKRTTIAGFFSGGDENGSVPGLWLLVASTAIS